jgi:hypothetical protein
VDRKLVSMGLVVACLLAGCGSTTPTSPPASPASSPLAQVDASAPAVNVVQAPPSSSEPAPSASEAPQPKAPDPEAVRAAAGAGFLAAGVANWQALHGLVGLTAKQYPLGEAKVWGQYAGALKQLGVPADTAADVHVLIRKITRYQALLREEAAACAARRMARCYNVAGHRSNTLNKVEGVAARVRTDLDLPLRPFHFPDPYSPDFSYP